MKPTVKYGQVTVRMDLRTASALKRLLGSQSKNSYERLDISQTDRDNFSSLYMQLPGEF